MGFQESVKIAYNKYADFTGTASKAEFWWYSLYFLILLVIAAIIEEIIWPGQYSDWGPIMLLVAIVHALPNWSTGARRLHDIGRTGWWQLLIFTGLGFLVLIYWWVQPSKYQNNVNETEFNFPDLNREEINREAINRSQPKNNDNRSGKIKFR